jgi:hypothetical protein
MPELTEQIHRYVQAAGRDAETRASAYVAAPAPGRGRGRPSRRSAFWLAAAAAMILVVIVGVAIGRDPRTDETTPAQATSPIFSTSTGTALVFTDGLSGVITVDLDTGLAVRRGLDGERAGDPPFRLTDTGDALVVGWGDITAVALDGSGSTVLDEATIYVPAAEPGEVWTLDWPDGRMSPTPATVQRVNATGEVTFDVAILDMTTYDSLAGVPGGLAVGTADGIGIWNAETGEIVDHPGPGRATGAASNGNVLVWCHEDCNQPQVLELDERGARTPPAVSFGNPVFSPDGTKVAYPANLGGESGVGVLDLQTGATTRVATGIDDIPSIGWSADGSQLFVAGYAYQQDSTTIGRYEMETGSWERHTIDIGGGLAFITLTPERASWLLSTPPGSPAACQRVTTYGVDRAPCAYTVTTQ